MLPCPPKSADASAQIDLRTLEKNRITTAISMTHALRQWTKILRHPLEAAKEVEVEVEVEVEEAILHVLQVDVEVAAEVEAILHALQVDVEVGVAEEVVVDYPCLRPFSRDRAFRRQVECY